MDYASGAHPAGQVVETPTLGGVTYQLWQSDKMGVAANGKGWTLLSFKSPTVQHEGTVRIDEMLGYSVERKLVNPSDSLASVEFGNELMGGSRTTWVQHLEVEIGDGH